MQRIHQLIFATSLLAGSWFFMMAVHELGHVLGAVVTGGRVTRVVLHPLAISRTDVAPNPRPAVVVWLGPLVGSLLPLVLVVAAQRLPILTQRSLKFVAGFCLIANGAYISFGSFNGVGDCGEMLSSGTPLWVMHLFGIAAMTAGFLIWHRLGSLNGFWKDRSNVTPTATFVLLLVIITVLVAEFALSPQ